MDEEEIEEEVPTSSDSEVEKKEMTWFYHIIMHFKNSSLLMFPQGSAVRNYCQLCIQQDPGSIETKTETKSSHESFAQKSNQVDEGMSPPKVGSLQEGSVSVAKPKRAR